MATRRTGEIDVPFSLWRYAVLGLIFSLIVILLLTIATAIVGAAIELPGHSERSIALGLQYAAILIGAALAGKKAKQKGIAVGCLVGAFFSLIQLAAAYSGGTVTLFSADSLLRIAGSLFCGAVGGIIGVNF
ncbi:MAG: TIGR04086 family membrane protein [Firmicutes bacterium]|nr:TIGR04086 family membrane protein [Bacillota bacterium]